MGRAAPVQEQYRRLIKPRGLEKRSSAGTRDPRVKVGRTRLSTQERRERRVSLNLATRRKPFSRARGSQAVTVGRIEDCRYPEKKERHRVGQPRACFMPTRRPAPETKACASVNRRTTAPRRAGEWLLDFTDNDPSAGSPTETLLRLLLSPSDRVRASSRPTSQLLPASPRPIRGAH